jgi:ABC-type branched-subunit amino acid transport system substrate-binding protein
VCCALLAACGSRLTPQERSAVLAGSGGAADAGAGGTGTGGAGGAAAGTAGPAATAGSGGGGQASGGNGGGAGGAGSGGGGGGSGGAARTCTGRGGATATGVTANEITLANASDISGPVPGLFESAQQATKAYVAYFNATQGGICGRKLKLISLDSRTDSGGDQQATIQACQKAFALVGSMSGYDQGGAQAAAGCGIPDIRTASVTSQRQRTAVSFGTNSTKVNLFPAAVPDFFKAKYPAAAGKAAFLYLNSDVTRQNAKSWISAYQKRGFTWVYEQAVDISDFNYSPYVLQMKQKGVRFVTWLGAYQQAARLAQAMRQQGFTPDVFLLDPTAYNPEYASQGGAAVAGTWVFINTILLEEIGSSPEMQLYRQWLSRAAPGAKPTYFGMYAWAATALFVQLAAKVGPNLTRPALIQQLRGVRGYTGNGMFAAQDVGAKRSSPCAAFIRLQGGRWTRQSPSRGWTCAGLVDSGVGG